MIRFLQIITLPQTGHVMTLFAGYDKSKMLYQLKNGK